MKRNNNFISLFNVFSFCFYLSSQLWIQMRVVGYRYNIAPGCFYGNDGASDMLKESWHTGVSLLLDPNF